MIKDLVQLKFDNGPKLPAVSMLQRIMACKRQHSMLNSIVDPSPKPKPKPKYKAKAEAKAKAKAQAKV